MHHSTRLGLALASLALLAPARAPAGPRDAVRCAPIVAEGPFPTQHAELRMLRPLGDSLDLGGTSFPVARDGDRLRVDGRKVAKSGEVLRLPLPDGDDTREVRVLVRPAADDWEWAVVEARLLAIDGVEVELLDADGDGRFTLDGDAIRYPPSRFLMPLGPTVIAGRARLAVESLSPDGLHVTGEVVPLEGSRHQLDGLVRINERRAEHGLPPVVVDPETSAGCTAHAAYLVKHKWRPGKFNPHGEVRRFKGFSEAGHRAAMASVIAWSDHGSAADAYWDTYYHRFPLAHPGTRGIGLSDGSPSVSVIDGKTATDRTADGWNDAILVPADGAVIGTGAFHRGGEIPEPVEQPGIRGFPLTVQLLGGGSSVTDFRARLGAIDGKGREKDVPLLVPDARGATDRLGAIPELPLRSGVGYVVTYTFTRDGEPHELRASFRLE